MAHHVGGEFGCELSPVGEAPEKLCGPASVHKSDDTEVQCRIILDVLEVLAGSRDEELPSI